MVMFPSAPPLVRPLFEYADFNHVDYVESALNNQFSLKLTSIISTRKYVARVLAMARAYRVLGVTSRSGKTTWEVLSFTEIEIANAELKKAEQLTSIVLSGDVFRIEMFQPVMAPKQPADFRRRNKGLSSHTILFVGGGNRILAKTDKDPWKVLAMNV
jgi:hypothetical protein